MRCVPFQNYRYLWLLAAALFVAAPTAARAGDPETCVFSITVDGKKSGEYLLTIQKHDGDVTCIAAQSSVKVTKLAITFYEYSYRGLEVWKGSRLVSFESSGKENSKTFSVTAKLDGDALAVKANGSESRARADSWMTSCCRLPEAAFRNNTVPMLGCDSGAQTSGRLEYVGSEEISVAGAKQTCSHYRVTKDAVHDVWYDAQERIVRDEWTSNGHTTVLEMTEMRR